MPEGHEDKKKDGKWKIWWRKDQLGYRLLLGLLITLALGAFLHFREVRVEILELDASAKNYVVAQVDFAFPDQEATVILRQEASRDVGNVYKLDIDEVNQRRAALEDYLVHNQNWRRLLPDTSFEEIYDTAETVKSKLLQVHFADYRTLQKVKSLELTDHPYFLLPQNFDTRQIHLPGAVWLEFKNSLAQEGTINGPTTNFVIDFYKKYTWELELDPTSQRLLRKSIESSVVEKFTTIHAGSRIINQGETVTQRHMAMMQSMKFAMRESRNLWAPLTLLGSLIFATVITLLGGFYFKISNKGLVRSLHKLSLYATIIILTLLNVVH